MKYFNKTVIVMYMLLQGASGLAFPNEPEQVPPPESKMLEKDVVLSEKGYFVITKGRPETDVITGIRRALEHAPTSKNFECETSVGTIDKTAYEGYERDLFFFSTRSGKLALLNMVDVKGDYSKAYRPAETDIIRVNGSPGIISLVVARDGGEKTRWGVGWRYLGAAAGLYIEDSAPPSLNKNQVIQVAESMRCRRR